MKMKPCGEYIMWTDLQDDTSTEWAFDNHLNMNAHCPPNTHLFTFATESGSFTAMRKSWFMSHCNEIWMGHGLDHMLGHSFRIGGTTHLLLLGVDPFIVMVQGHWKFAAFLEYWHNCEDIIPMFIGFSLNSRSSVLSGVASFKEQLLTRM